MTTATETTGLVGYYSEMGEKRPAAAVIDARLGHYGKHYYLTTRLVLKGRGIELLDSEDSHVHGFRYKVTLAAFEKICREHLVASESLL